MLLPGPTLVVSPLLALQHDQIAALDARGAGAAAAISSAESRPSGATRWTRCAPGAEFLFVTPEQLADPDLLREIAAAEAVAWSRSTRRTASRRGVTTSGPTSCARRGRSRRSDRPPVVALTATASPPVRDDIAERLGMRAPAVIVAGLDRPNLYLAAAHCVDEDDSGGAGLVQRLSDNRQPGIVYVGHAASRPRDWPRALTPRLPAPAYHGGLSTAERDARARGVPRRRGARAWSPPPRSGWASTSRTSAASTTCTLPDSPDAYFQEVGRAGRDGASAQARLFYRRQDLALHRFFAGANRVVEDDVVRLLRALASLDGAVPRRDLARASKLSEVKTGQIASVLAALGALALTPTGRIQRATDSDGERHAATVVARLEHRREAARARLDLMRAYAECSGCRRAFVLRYFGERTEDACGACDNCQSGRAERVASRLAAGDAHSSAPDFKVDTWVRHRRHGVGLIVGRSGDEAEVLFETAGRQAMLLDREIEAGVLALHEDR